MPAARPVAPPPDLLPLAARGAALLLTGKPVCVTGGGGLPAADRLRFLDTVASLLPYGMRGRLSAATWTSSTYQQHLFRLFFSSAPRQRDDHLLAWGRPGSGSLGDPGADAYLDWLLDDTGLRVAMLAAEAEVTDFTGPGAAAVLHRLGVFREEPGATGPSGATGLSGEAGQGGAAARAGPGAARPAGGPEQPGPGPARPRRRRQAALVEDLVRDLGQSLEAGRPGLSLISALRDQPASAATPEDRKRYQRIIQAGGLLRAGRTTDRQVQAELYAVLLPLAFGQPLTYEGLCQAEECAGLPVPHAMLLAMDDGAIDTAVTRALVRLLRQRAAEGTPGQLVQPGRLPRQDDLVMLAVRPGLRPAHARLAWQALHQRSLDQPALRAQLHEAGYFAAQLEAVNPGQPEQAVTAIARLLRLAYGQQLDRIAVRDILGRDADAPPPTMLAAVLICAEPGLRGRSRLRQALVRTVG